ncbi:MAG: hypothetical protein ACRES7_00220 [Gammaproteobacteria bacterium]
MSAPTPVQSKSNQSSSAATLGIVFDAAPGVGNILIAQVNFVGTGASDPAVAPDGTWYPLLSGLNYGTISGYNGWQDIWYHEVESGEANSYTFGIGAATPTIWSVVVDEYSGVDVASVLDVATVLTATGNGKTFAAPANTTLDANALVLFCNVYYDGANQVYTAPSGYSQDGLNSVAGAKNAICSIAQATAGGTGTPSASINGSVNKLWGVALLALKASTAAHDYAAAAGASYALTGAAGGTVQRIAAAGASVALAGASAGSAQRSGAAGGVFVAGGADAGIVLHWLIAGAGAAFAGAGSPAGTARRAGAAGTAFALAGADAAGARRSGAAGGVFAWSGAQATMRLHLFVAGAGATFNWVGAGAFGTGVQRYFGAASGATFAIAGAHAVIVLHWHIAGAGAVFVANGAAAGSAQHRAAAGADMTLAGSAAASARRVGAAGPAFSTQGAAAGWVVRLYVAGAGADFEWLGAPAGTLFSGRRDYHAVTAVDRSPRYALSMQPGIQSAINGGIKAVFIED